MSFLIAVLVDFAPILMPKWSQVPTKVEAKTDLNTKRPQSLKCYKNQHLFNDFRVRGNRFGKKKRSNIDEKTEPMSKCVLTSIFDRSSVILGRVWGGKTHRKTIEKNVEKTTSEK